MKRSLSLLTIAFAAMLLAAGCSKKDPKPSAPKGYKTYTDASLNFLVKYPDGWAQAVQPGTVAAFYSNKPVADAFGNFEPNGQRGAKIEIRAVKGGDEDVMKSIGELKSLFTDPSVVKEPEKAMLNGIPATKVSYGFDVENTKFSAERYYLVRDSVVTYFETAVIGTNNSDFKAMFDTAAASFIPGGIVAQKPAASAGTAKPDSVVDVNEPPAETQKTYSAGSYSISYPSNFSPSGSGSSVTLSGARNDCIIRVDVIDPKGVPLDKIASENSKVYHSAPTKTNVGGKPAYLFNYGGSGVASRAYFVMGASKMYRITTTIYKPQLASYQGAYDKAVGSFRGQ